MFGYKPSTLAGFFVVILMANLLLGAALLSTGLEGEFDIVAAGETFFGFFGGFMSLFAVLFVVLLLAIVYFGGVKLSENGHHQLVGAVIIVALIIGGFILWRWVDWDALQFDGWSALWLIIFTLVESVVALAVLSSSGVQIRRPKKAATTSN